MRMAGVFLAATLSACIRVNVEQHDHAEEKEVFLFSYFMRNGEGGTFLAYSRDGVSWSPLNGGRAIIKPQISGSGLNWQQWNSTAQLMRDPCILRGPYCVFHLVWTVSWNDHAFGVAHSSDLVNWSEQTRVGVMAHEPNALNGWAPDLFYDDATKQFVIVWATSIPGRFPATEPMAQKTSRGAADHRLYFVTTKDFKSYSNAALLYDGGFAAIDGTIRKSGDTYYLVMKDETFFPETRYLRVATSKHATGPYGPAGPPITTVHTEGPSILRSNEWWYVYYDEYTRGRYGAVRTKDFVTFESVSDSLRLPRGVRHGSAFLAPESVVEKLLAGVEDRRPGTVDRRP
jgi:hypothetical protein